MDIRRRVKWALARHYLSMGLYSKWESGGKLGMRQAIQERLRWGKDDKDNGAPVRSCHASLEAIREDASWREGGGCGGSISWSEAEESGKGREEVLGDRGLTAHVPAQSCVLIHPLPVSSVPACPMSLQLHLFSAPDQMVIGK